MYHVDSYDNSLVIDGFEKGIADSPHNGIADMRNVNVISVPGEASVNFATTQSSTSTVGTGTVTSASGVTHYFSYTGATGLANGQAIVFSGGSLPTGITAGTVYWFAYDGVGNQIYSNFTMTSQVLISGTGTGTFTVYNQTTPKHFAHDTVSDSYWMVDDIGQVWTTAYPLSATPPYAGTTWRYTGNSGGNGSGVGNGLVFYQASDGTGYIFVFRNSRIDYTKSVNTLISWVYGWNPADATTGNTTTYLKTGSGTPNSHEAFVAPDNRVYFCDSNWIGAFYETSPSVPFVPTTLASFTYSQTQLLPATDVANCLAFLGTNVLVGGGLNVIYPWDRSSTHFNYPILLAENNVSKMVTINTTTYIFVGNRGRIYYTNGTNVQLYKKVPDHISGTIEPYFTWGGATYTKNQLYFGVKVTTNGGVDVTQYGGLWAIDVDTNSLRLVNQLSYGTYSGYASAIIARIVNIINPANPPGTGLYIGWDSGASTYGIDTSLSTPYTGSQATIDTDLIPIGTFNKPRDLTQVEYRLTKPLVSGESVLIKTRLIFNTQDTGYTTTLTDSTVGNYSNTSPVNFKNAQWVQFQIVLNSTASTPSYTRLKQIRILGITGAVASGGGQ